MYKIKPLIWTKFSYFNEDQNYLYTSYTAMVSGGHFVIEYIGERRPWYYLHVNDGRQNFEINHYRSLEDAKEAAQAYWNNELEKSLVKIL